MDIQTNCNKQELLDKHREEAVITCPEDCWCWNLEAELNKGSDN